MSHTPTSYLPQINASAGELAEAVDAILAAATLEEKVGMMSGKGFFAQIAADKGRWGANPYRAGSGIERLDIPALYFTDGPRGVARGSSTAFPCTMARGASFDTDLEFRIGEVMGIETRAQGCNLNGAVCINILRHPAWGRAQETYGEDQHHLGAMGAALATGIQAHNVIATVKHYALNSMENMRFVVDVRVDERSLHEVYLPHFKQVVDAGVLSVMSSYNQYNGEFCGQNGQLLTDILRGEWGFQGFVHSDWVKGVYKVYGAAAGLDIENPEPQVFGDKLVKAVEAGTVEPQVIDLACRRILTTQLYCLTREDPLPEYGMDLVACDRHTQLAREAAQKSAVLLRNQGALPLDPAKLGKIALLGKLALMPNTGDNGSSRVQSPYVVTPADGLIARLGADAVLTAIEDDLDAVAQAVDASDAVVIVAGYTAEDEGEYIPSDVELGQMERDRGGDEVEESAAVAELKKMRKPRLTSVGGDRSNLGLPDAQVAMINAAIDAAGTRPVIVVLVGGSAIMVEGWHDRVSAILQTFYAGMEGGNALADILLGDVSPAGKLPFTVACEAQDYPHFDRLAKVVEYDYWHGYAKFERDDVAPRYPFGHGLTYSRFDIRSLKARVQGDWIEASVAVRNVGDVASDIVPLCYVGVPGQVVERPLRSLRDFKRIHLAPGAMQIVPFRIPLDALRWRDPATHSWHLEPGAHRVIVEIAPGQTLETTVQL